MRRRNWRGRPVYSHSPGRAIPFNVRANIPAIAARAASIARGKPADGEHRAPRHRPPARPLGGRVHHGARADAGGRAFQRVRQRRHRRRVAAAHAREQQIRLAGRTVAAPRARGCGRRRSCAQAWPRSIAGRRRGRRRFRDLARKLRHASLPGVFVLVGGRVWPAAGPKPGKCGALRGGRLASAVVNGAVTALARRAGIVMVNRKLTMMKKSLTAAVSFALPSR